MQSVSSLAKITPSMELKVVKECCVSISPKDWLDEGHRIYLDDETLGRNVSPELDAPQGHTFLFWLPLMSMHRAYFHCGTLRADVKTILILTLRSSCCKTKPSPLRAQNSKFLNTDILVLREAEEPDGSGVIGGPPHAWTHTRFHLSVSWLSKSVRLLFWQQCRL